MKKRLILCVVTLLVLSQIAYSQAVQRSDSVVNGKASYLKGDLAVLLTRNTNYPFGQLSANPGAGGEGDVVLSLVIHANGKSDVLSVVSSPDISFSTSSIVAYTKLEDAWAPATINKVPTDKNYLIVFRYKKYLDSQPYDYKRKIEESMSKQKYKEALRLLSNAIHDNKYDRELFTMRSKVKQILNDVEGAKSDELTATKLNDEILAVVTVQVIGRSTKRVVSMPPVRRR
jgi:hypothetical protein